MNCKDLRVFKLDFYKVADEKSTLEKLLISLPALEVLHLDSYFLEVRNSLPVVSVEYLLIVIVNSCDSD